MHGYFIAIQGEKTFMVSHKAMDTSGNGEFITENIIEKISELQNKDGKDIWIPGGGRLIALLLNAGLIDELQICYIPIILGTGIPLFPDNTLQESNCELIENMVYNSSVIRLNYRIIK